MSEQIPNMDYNADEVIKGFKEKFRWAKADEVQAVVKPKKYGFGCFFPCSQQVLQAELFIIICFLR